MTDPLNPFTVEQLLEIDKGIELANTAEAAVNKATSAGIPMDGQLGEVREMRKKLQQIKRVYGTP